MEPYADNTAILTELQATLVAKGGKVKDKTKFLEVMTEIIDPESDYTDIKEKLIEAKIATERDFQSAINKWIKKRKVSETFGEYPSGPVSFVELFAKREGVELTLNGLLTKQGGYYDYHTMHAELVLMEHELKIGYSIEVIKAAHNQWCYSEIERVKVSMREAVKFAEAKIDETKDDWKFLATRFKEPYAVDVIRKFMWSVKRKMAKMPVTYPIMPIIFDTIHRNGKSYLLIQLMSPVSFVNTSFGQVIDDRNLDLWKNYILYLGEMRKPSRDMNIEAVKNNITSETISIRVLGTMKTQTIVNSATFIGDSNYPVETILYDTSGMGRFVQISWITIAEKDKPAVWAEINKLNWLAMWQSVDETADDPTAIWRDEISVQQEEVRAKTTVEHWLNDLERDEHRDFRGMDSSYRGEPWTKRKEARKLYHENFMPWCAYNGHVAMNENNFSKEMHRLNEGCKNLYHSKSNNVAMWAFDSRQEDQKCPGDVEDWLKRQEEQSSVTTLADKFSTWRRP